MKGSQPGIPMGEQIDSLDLRLEGEVARLRETIEAYSLNLFSKAIEAMSSLEQDWVRARAEADSLREKLREARLDVGELQQQLDRITDLRRRTEAESTALREELQRELTQVKQELAQAGRELAQARKDQQAAVEARDAANRECLQMQQRISWRLTKPLRYVRRLIPKSHA